MKKIFLITLVLAFSGVSNASDVKEGADFALGLMAIGKLTGGCGIFKLQLDFQDNTDLKGGEDFLNRFWSMEAARLGKTLEEYVKDCHETVDKYKTYQTMFAMPDEK